MRPALVTGSAVVGLAGIAALMIPTRRSAERQAAQAEPAPVLETASH